MKKVKLYTKYKFTQEETEALCLVCKVSADELEDKLDSLSYNERKSLYQTIPLINSLKKCKGPNFQ